MPIYLLSPRGGWPAIYLVWGTFPERQILLRRGDFNERYIIHTVAQRRMTGKYGRAQKWGNKEQMSEHQCF